MRGAGACSPMPFGFAGGPPRRLRFLRRHGWSHKRGLSPKIVDGPWMHVESKAHNIGDCCFRTYMYQDVLIPTSCSTSGCHGTFCNRVVIANDIVVVQISAT